MLNGTNEELPCLYDKREKSYKKRDINMCSGLTMKTSKRRHWTRSAVFIIDVESILHLILVIMDFHWVFPILLCIILEVSFKCFIPKRKRKKKNLFYCCLAYCCHSKLFFSVYSKGFATQEIFVIQNKIMHTEWDKLLTNMKCT